MSKQDWLDYFEAVNGRSASAKEIAQALAAGEFQEEVVVPETPQAPEFVAAPTALWKNQLLLPNSPEFVAAPTALWKNQLLPTSSRVCLQRQLPC